MLDLAKVISETRVRLCLDCGKCTVVCPVTRYDADFNPRLIVQDALDQNGSTPADRRIWSCLSCNMCIERCNYNVKFTDFIRALRYRALAGGVEIDFTHGGTPQSMMHIMGQKDTRQNRLGWLPDDIKLERQCDTAFFVGCSPYFDVLFADLGVKTLDGVRGALRLLNRAGRPFTLLSNERCCGRDLLVMGDYKGFIDLAAINLAEFHKRGIKNIITSCPECYYTLRVDYPRYVEGWDISVTHLTEVIAPQAGSKGLSRTARRVTYQDPCTLGRYSRLFDPPRRLLTAVNGLELVEMANNRERALCCGANPWAYCGSVNKMVQKERLAQAGETGADLLVTACPKCQIHLRCAQKNAEGNGVCQIEIRDLYDVLAESSLAEEKG